MDVNSELIDAQVEIKDTDNAFNANKKGLLWFNRVSDKLKMIYNGVVENIANETYVDDEIDASEAALVANSLVTTEQVTPSTPATDLRRVYAKTDGIYELGSDGTEYKLLRVEDQVIIDHEVVFINYTSAGSDYNDFVATLYTATQDWDVCTVSFSQYHSGNSASPNCGSRINGTYYDITPVNRSAEWHHLSFSRDLPSGGTVTGEWYTSFGYTQNRRMRGTITLIKYGNSKP